MRQRWLIFLLSITLLGLALPASASAGPATGAFVVVLHQPIPMDPASAMPGQMALLPMLDTLVETGAIRSYTPYLGINAIVVHGDASSRQLLASWPGVARLRDEEAAATLETYVAGLVVAAPATGTARIQGTVTGPGGGLAGMSVKAYRYNNVIWVVVGTATTAANGSYDIPALASGVYKVGFSDPAGNYIPEFYDDKADLYSGNPFNLADGQVKTGVDALLARAGRIAGALTTTGGSAVASFGAFAWRLVGSEWTVAGYTSSGADGKYIIGGLPADSYRVQFADATSPPRYLAEYYDNVTEPSLATPVSVVAGATTANINASLGGYGKMTGKVTAADGTTALDDINVDLYQYNAASGEWEWASFSSTDATGNYQVDGLVTRNYRVQFTDPQNFFVGEYYNDKPSLATADNVAVQLGLTTSGINASLARPCYFADVHPNADHSNPDLCDGDVDVADTQRVASCWLQNVGPACPQTLDFDLSGTIDVLDLIVVAGEWGWPDFATAGFGRGP